MNLTIEEKSRFQYYYTMVIFEISTLGFGKERFILSHEL